MPESSKRRAAPGKPPGLPAYNPQLALLVGAPPGGGGWFHEIKYDGYRIGAAIRPGTAGRDVRLLSRRGIDWTDKFTTIAAAAAALPVQGPTLLDGEVVVLRPDGRSDFSGLQNAVGRSDPRLT